VLDKLNERELQRVAEKVLEIKEQAEDANKKGHTNEDDK
jgi:hypothetical protein